MHGNEYDLFTAEQSLTHTDTHQQPASRFNTGISPKNAKHNSPVFETKMQCDVDDNDSSGRFSFIKSNYLFQTCGIYDNDGENVRH